MKQKNNPYSDAQRLRLAKVSISTSAFRGQGKSGLIRFTQRYLVKKVCLHEMSESLKSGSYEQYLDNETMKLKRAAASYDCQWGTARKGLNIFFRDVLYNSYFFQKLKLSFSHGHQMEIPLDSKTMRKIRSGLSELKKHDLKLVQPKRTTIIGLDKKNSKAYQEAATKIAKLNSQYAGYTRVDLDMKFWAED